LKIKSLFFLLPVLVYGQNLLNDLKQKELGYDAQKAVQDSLETEKSWINPLTLQYSYTKDNMLNTATVTKLFSISVNQPVFKSGAIYYSIKYAAHSKSYNLLNISIQKRELIKRAIDLAFDYKINQLNKQIVQLNIKNALIDINKKKESFLNGVGDSVLLNNAVLKLNSLKLSMADLKANDENIKTSFANISSLDISKVTLPVFKIISKKEFLNSNLEFIQQEKLKKIKHDLYKMQLGNQMLSVSLNGSLNWQNVDYSQNTPQLQDYKRDYYRVGVSVILPLSVNALNKIEKTKIDYLKSGILIEDKKQQLLNLYKNILNQIKSVNEKINVYKSNIRIYEDLIDSTKDSISAGNATKSDLQIMLNSKQTSIVNIEILKLKKQKLLLQMYYKLNNWKN